MHYRAENFAEDLFYRSGGTAEGAGADVPRILAPATRCPPEEELMRRNKLVSSCVAALLVGVLAVPALTVRAAQDEWITPVHRDTAALQPEPTARRDTPRDRFTELYRSLLEWVLRRRPELPEGPPEDPPVKPEAVPTIDPSGYTPGRP
jgi:hypothetical protein